METPAKHTARVQVEIMQRIVNYPGNPDHVKIEALCKAVAALAAVVLAIEKKETRL